MAKKKERIPPIAQDYNAAVEAADLLDIKLIRSDFDIQPSYFAAVEEDLSFRYHCEVEKMFYREGAEHLIAEVALAAGCKQGRKWVLRGRSTYLVAYTVEGRPTVQAAEEYLNKVARFTAYPYFRAHFAGLCSQAGAQMPPLPVMKGNIPRKIGGAENRTGVIEHAD